MQLALRQDREADPVMFAVTHFTEYAADWQDVMFLPQYSLSHLIPWTELGRPSCIGVYLYRLAMLHWKTFNGLKMQHNMSVNKHSAVY